MADKKVWFNGNEYNLVSNGRYYIRYYKDNENRKRNAKSLHVDVFEYYSGVKVERGFEVHHKDFNSLNNSYENLELLSVEDHRKIHIENNRNNGLYDNVVFKGQDKAREWHRSEEGNKWHKEHAKVSILKMPLVDVKCQECGLVFNTKRPSVATTCSTMCRQRLQKRNGVGFYYKKCSKCGIDFYTKKRKTKEANCCSKRCGMSLSIENRRLLVNNKTGRFEKIRNQEDENEKY